MSRTRRNSRPHVTGGGGPPGPRGAHENNRLWPISAKKSAWMPVSASVARHPPAVPNGQDRRQCRRERRLLAGRLAVETLADRSTGARAITMAAADGNAECIGGSYLGSSSCAARRSRGASMEIYLERAFADG